MSYQTKCVEYAQKFVQQLNDPTVTDLATLESCVSSGTFKAQVLDQYGVLNDTTRSLYSADPAVTATKKNVLLKTLDRINPLSRYKRFNEDVTRDSLVGYLELNRSREQKRTSTGDAHAMLTLDEVCDVVEKRRYKESKDALVEVAIKHYLDPNVMTTAGVSGGLSGGVSGGVSAGGMSGGALTLGDVYDSLRHETYSAHDRLGISDRFRSMIFDAAIVTPALVRGFKGAYNAGQGIAAATGIGLGTAALTYVGAKAAAYVAGAAAKAIGQGFEMVGMHDASRIASTVGTTLILGGMNGYGLTSALMLARGGTDYASRKLENKVLSLEQELTTAAGNTTTNRSKRNAAQGATTFMNYMTVGLDWLLLLTLGEGTLEAMGAGALGFQTPPHEPLFSWSSLLGFAGPAPATPGATPSAATDAACALGPVQSEFDKFLASQNFGNNMNLGEIHRTTDFDASHWQALNFQTGADGKLTGGMFIGNFIDDRHAHLGPGVAYTQGTNVDAIDCGTFLRVTYDNASDPRDSFTSLIRLDNGVAQLDGMTPFIRDNINNVKVEWFTVDSVTDPWYAGPKYNVTLLDEYVGPQFGQAGAQPGDAPQTLNGVHLGNHGDGAAPPSGPAAPPSPDSLADAPPGVGPVRDPNAVTDLQVQRDYVDPAAMIASGADRSGAPSIHDGAGRLGDLHASLYNTGKPEYVGLQIETNGHPLRIVGVDINGNGELDGPEPKREAVDTQQNTLPTMRMEIDRNMLHPGVSYNVLGTNLDGRVIAHSNDFRVGSAGGYAPLGDSVPIDHTPRPYYGIQQTINIGDVTINGAGAGGVTADVRVNLTGDGAHVPPPRVDVAAPPGASISAGVTLGALHPTFTTPQFLENTYTIQRADLLGKFDLVGDKADLHELRSGYDVGVHANLTEPYLTEMQRLGYDPRNLVVVQSLHALDQMPAKIGDSEGAVYSVSKGMMIGDRPDFFSSVEQTRLMPGQYVDSSTGSTSLAGYTFGPGTGIFAQNTMTIQEPHTCNPHEEHHDPWYTEVEFRREKRDVTSGEDETLHNAGAIVTTVFNDANHDKQLTLDEIVRVPIVNLGHPVDVNSDGKVDDADRVAHTAKFWNVGQNGTRAFWSGFGLGALLGAGITGIITNIPGGGVTPPPGSEPTGGFIPPMGGPLAGR